MVAVGSRQMVARQGEDLEAVVRPVVYAVVRPMAMDLVVAARPMEVSILRRFGPVGGPPGLTPSSASNAQEFSRPIFVDFVCRADPLRICVVCLERQTGNPPGPGDSGSGAPKGDGSAGDAKKAKCKSFRLEPEPEPAQLRRWIVEMKERVANAFAYDPNYALAWVEIPDGTRYEDLADECKYEMLENECIPRLHKVDCFEE